MSKLGTLSVIFDLDGTLVDSEPNYYEAGRQTLAEHGVPDFTWAEHERYVGVSTRETAELWKREYGLAASVWTKDIGKERATAARLQYGCTWINTHFMLTNEMPHGGLKQSGYGKDMSLYALEDYTAVRHVMVAHG